MPTAPAPVTSALPPLGTSTRSTAFSATAMGSTSAPCSSERPSGRANTDPAGASTYSASPPPGEVTPIAARAEHRWDSPEVQRGHTPQVRIGRTQTRSPGATRSTPSPRATTVPANSCPSVCGRTAPVSGLGSCVARGVSKYSCTSVPQIPAYATRIFTSPGPGSGSGISSIRRSSVPYSLAASMAPPRDRFPSASAACH